MNEPTRLTADDVRTHTQLSESSLTTHPRKGKGKGNGKQEGEREAPPLPRTPPRGVLALDPVVTSAGGFYGVPDQVRNPSTRGRAFPTLGGTLTGERHERVRQGERTEIPRHVRSAVWYRDRGLCELCGFEPAGPGAQIDHITPWSAGGSDRSENLRVLCEAHNQERSNFVDPTERQRRPVTWWCLNCYSVDPTIWERELPWNERAICWWGTLVHPDYTCRVSRVLARDQVWGETSDWYVRSRIDPDDDLVVAYCAHCDAPGLTDVTL